MCLLFVFLNVQNRTVLYASIDTDLVVQRQPEFLTMLNFASEHLLPGQLSERRAVGRLHGWELKRQAALWSFCSFVELGLKLLGELRDFCNPCQRVRLSIGLHLKLTPQVQELCLKNLQVTCSLRTAAELSVLDGCTCVSVLTKIPSMKDCPSSFLNVIKSLQKREVFHFLGGPWRKTKKFWGFFRCLVFFLSQSHCFLFVILQM